MKPIALSTRLLRWYRTHGRRFPWRQTRGPYRIWVSEIVLQQTQVETVIPYYRRFFRAFPFVQALAAASADQVLKENLGYYARARHLHQAARDIVARHGASCRRTNRRCAVCRVSAPIRRPQCSASPSESRCRPSMATLPAGTFGLFCVV